MIIANILIVTGIILVISGFIYLGFCIRKNILGYTSNFNDLINSQDEKFVFNPMYGIWAEMVGVMIILIGTGMLTFFDK